MGSSGRIDTELLQKFAGAFSDLDDARAPLHRLGRDVEHYQARWGAEGQRLLHEACTVEDTSGLEAQKDVAAPALEHTIVCCPTGHADLAQNTVLERQLLLVIAAGGVEEA
jgi:hypothetical protein